MRKKRKEEMYVKEIEREREKEERRDNEGEVGTKEHEDFIDCTLAKTGLRGHREVRNCAFGNSH